MDRDLFDAILGLEELSRVRADRCVVVSKVYYGANDLNGVVGNEANAGVRGLSTPKCRINRSPTLSFGQSPCLFVDLVSRDSKWKLGAFA